jgi:hypothetical protein
VPDRGRRNTKSPRGIKDRGLQIFAVGQFTLDG